MNTPPDLQKGDLIALAAPASSIQSEQLKEAIKVIVQKGYNVRSDIEVLAVHHQFAGDVTQRRRHFQQLLDDPDIHAIFCARGGYGSLQIVDHLDFTGFRKHPKWVVGYSDITVLHARILAEGFESLHATMPVNFSHHTADSLNSLFDSLEGKPLSYTIAPHPMNRYGQAVGRLIGGNLSMLYSLQGSALFPAYKECILFLEDVGEYLYHIDRMILSLKRAGLFNQIAGLIIGGFTKMKDTDIPFGQQAYEIIASQLTDYSFPMMFGFPAGHLDDNRALIIGRNMQMSVSPHQVMLKEEAQIQKQ